MALTALLPRRLFTGDRFREKAAVLIDDGRVADVIAAADVPADVPRQALPGLLAPGWVDAQVNGGGGVLFNEERSPAALERLAQAHARYGTTALLPTFITDRPQAMTEAVAAVRTAMREGVPGVAGIHLEGPFLSVARKGAHDPALIRPLTDADVDGLLMDPVRPTLLTVAAENASPRLIRRLVDGGLIVSIGHSDAAYDVAMAAADAGARGITHLFNAMSQLGHRTPGVVGAALDHGALWGGLIADGHHVHPASLRRALAAKRAPGRLFLVTDAMPPAGSPGDRFELNGRMVERRDGRLTLADGTLAGSDLTMDRAIRYCVEELEVDLGEALRMASLYPAMFLGLDKNRGRIAPGTRADMVLLSDRLAVQGTWIGGVAIDPGQPIAR